MRGRPRRPPGVPQAAARPPRPADRAPAAGHPDRVRAPPGRHDASARWPAGRPALGPVEEIYEALVLGTHDYVTKNGFTDVVIGLSGGIDSSLVAVRRRRRARRRHGPRRVHAVALFERALRGDAPDLAERLGIDFRTVPIEAAHAAFLDTAGTVVRRARRGPDRGEPPEPHPRRAAHGPVQQARLDGAHDRQQERAGRRLLDALRRHRRRLRRDQGRAEDDGLRAVPLAQPWPRPAAGPVPSPRRCSPSRRRPSCGPTSATTRACPPTRCSTRSCEAYVERDLTADELVEAGFDEALVRRIVRLVDLAEYKRRQSPRACGSRQGVRQGPPGADHQPLPLMRSGRPGRRRHRHSHRRADLAGRYRWLEMRPVRDARRMGARPCPSSTSSCRSAAHAPHHAWHSDAVAGPAARARAAWTATRLTAPANAGDGRLHGRPGRAAGTRPDDREAGRRLPRACCPAPSPPTPCHLSHASAAHRRADDPLPAVGPRATSSRTGARESC